jgi:hypothetical protein
VAKRKATGTVRKLGVEGGLWALVTDDGEQIELIGAPAGLQKNGARAEVELDEAGADATVGMVGSAGRVRSFEIL